MVVMVEFLILKEEGTKP